MLIVYHNHLHYGQKTILLFKSKYVNEMVLGIDFIINRLCLFLTINICAGEIQSKESRCLISYKASILCETLL